jgi:hypothetical protein
MRAAAIVAQGEALESNDTMPPPGGMKHRRAAGATHAHHGQVHAAHHAR